MTPADLETYVRQRYNAIGDTFYPQLEIYNFFWQAQLELAMETYCIKNVYTALSVADQRAYDIPTNAIVIERVEYDGKRIFQNDLTDDDCYTANNPGTTTSGTPINYQRFGSTLYLRPIPSTDALTIKVFSSDQPTQPSSSGLLDVPSTYHLMLADYALYCMFSQDQNAGMADRHYQIWVSNKSKVQELETLKNSGDEFKVVKSIDDMSQDLRFW